MSTFNRNLPEDMIMQVLLNLPVKSLSRFVCVSKAWYAIIKGNTFVQNHLGHSAERFLVIYFEDGRHRRSKYLSDEFMEIIDHDFCRTLPDPDYDAVQGHCNGIFCFYDAIRGAGVLWNPANREIRAIPLFPRDYPNSHDWYGLRLGWDQRTNDYKVVLFSQRYDYYDGMPT